MAGFTNTYELNILRAVFLGEDVSSWQVSETGSFDIALFETVPGDDGTAGTEISGNNYSRVEIQVADLTVSEVGDEVSVSNDVDIAFPIPTDTWGTIQGFGIYTQSGALVAFDSFEFPITGDAGAQIKFSAGNLKLILD